MLVGTALLLATVKYTPLEAFLRRLDVQPDSTRLEIITELFAKLQDPARGNCFADLDDLFLHGAHDPQAGKVGTISARERVTYVGGGASHPPSSELFVADEGFSVGANNYASIRSYLSLGVNDDAYQHFTLNDGTIGVVCLSDISVDFEGGGYWPFLLGSGSGNSGISPNIGANVELSNFTHSAQMMGGAATWPYASDGSGLHHFCARRYSDLGGDTILYTDGNYFSDDTGAASALSGGPFHLGHDPDGADLEADYLHTLSGGDPTVFASYIGEMSASQVKQLDLILWWYYCAITYSIEAADMVDDYLLTLTTLPSWEERFDIAADAQDFIDNGVHAVEFDGSNDYLTRGADLTGISDGKEFTLSMWVRFIGADAAQNILLFTPGGGTGLSLYKNGDGKLVIIGFNSVGTKILDYVSTNTLNVADGWRHILISDKRDGNSYLYIDDVLQAAASVSVDEAYDFTAGDVVFGANNSGGFPMQADTTDIWFHPEFIDLSVEANRRKFIDASGKPVWLGDKGQVPLDGTEPILFLHDTQTSTWHTNKGSGGGFTENGALTDAPSSPSD